MTKILFTILILTISTSVSAQNVTEEWVQRYNGTANMDDYTEAMVVDAEGNVYVSGSTISAGIIWEVVTIKYNSSGDSLWGVKHTYFSVEDMAVDNSGNVVITGWNYSSGFIAIKYNPDGILQWSYYTQGGDNERAIALTVDTHGNIYVTGYTYYYNVTQFDYKTIKISPTGNLLWAKTYNGQSNSDDYARAIAVDAAGNVYVTGTVRGENFKNMIGTIKYNSSGTLMWARTWIGLDYSNANGYDLTLDNSGNVYIVGSGKGPSNTPFYYWNKYVTLKYNSAGTLLWTQIYEGVGGLDCDDDWGNAITSDESGNVYVTGGSMPNNCKVEIATIKYNSAGSIEWITRFVDPDGEDNEGSSVIVDNDGNVYVLGYTYEDRILIIKYNSTGQQEWYIKNTGPMENYFTTKGFGIDNSGNVYVAGSAQGIDSGRDIYTIKYFQGSPLVITKPTTNDKWMAGESDTIKWTGGQEGQFVIIEYSLDNGENYEIVSISTPADSGYFVWKVTDTLLTTKAKVKITDLFNPNIKSESSTFSIKPYILTRIDDNGNYYEYRKNRDQWGFSNIEIDMWPQTWWQQFNYQGTDPFTNSQYSQWQGDSVFNKMTAFPNVHMDWISWVNTFSVDACYWSTILNIYKKSALLKWWSKLKSWKGSCFGIAAANALAFSFKEEFQIVYHNFPDSINPISVTSNNDVKKVVSELFSHQYGNPTQANDVPGSAKTPNQTLDDIKEMLKDDNSAASTLSIFNNGVGGGGHTILAYGLKRDPVQNHIYYIQVYDNSNPNSNNPITVNTQGNGGNGTWSTPDWAGWGGNKGLNLEIQADTYLNGAFFPDGLQSQSPFRLSENVLEINYKSDSPIKIVDIHGNVTGFENNLVFNDIPGSLAMMVKDGSESPPYGYTLQTDNYSVILNEFESDTVNAFFFTGNKSFVLERKGAVQTETDKLFFDGGLSVTNPDAQIKTIKLLNLLDENTQEKFTVITGLDLAQNDSVKIENLDSNRIKLISFGTAKDYDLELSFLNESVSDRFIALNLNLPANSTHIIVPYWQDLMNTELMLLTDIGNNGIIDDTTFIDNVLPVDLISFDAIVDGRDVLLSWKTAWEVNNDRFEIFRKQLDDENTQWIKVGTIPGNGNTNEPVTYSFADKNLTTGKYEYKLIQIDYNGMQSADWELNQTVHIGVPDYFDLHQNYPNPFNPITKIDFQIPVDNFVTLRIYDMTGREVSTLINSEMQAGYHTVEFNGANFASGVYFYRLVTNNNVKTKKFMLLK